MFRRCVFWVGRSIRLPAEERRVLAARDNMVQGLLIGVLSSTTTNNYEQLTSDPGCCVVAVDRRCPCRLLGPAYRYQGPSYCSLPVMLLRTRLLVVGPTVRTVGPYR
jgi:hypothetical protein